MKSSKHKIIIIISATVVVLSIAVMVAIVVSSNSPSRRLKQQLDLGNRYLSELNYEQAIAAYEEALAIDPKSADAYAGLLEASIQSGDMEGAISVRVRAGENLQDTTELDERLVSGAFSYAQEAAQQNNSEAALRILEDTRAAVGDEAWNEAGVSADETYEAMREVVPKWLVSSITYYNVYDWADNVGGIANRAIFEYNEDGLLMKTYNEPAADSRGEKYQIIYEYDQSEKLIKESRTTDADYGNYEYVYEYDSSGKKIRQTGRRDGWQGETDIDETFEYDAEGKLIRSRMLDTVTGEEYISEYDPYGEVIRTTFHNGVNDYYTWGGIRESTGHERLKDAEVYYFGVIDASSDAYAAAGDYGAWKYDERGRKVIDASAGSDGFWEINIYEYDDEDRIINATHESEYPDEDGNRINTARKLADYEYMLNPRYAALFGDH